MTIKAYRHACRIEANKQWCYAGLVDDHPERLLQAHELGESPASFIKWLGEKYDLIRAEDW
jgi:hypothetical protein